MRKIARCTCVAVMLSGLVAGCARPVLSLGPALRPSEERRTERKGVSVELVLVNVDPRADSGLANASLLLHLRGDGPLRVAEAWLSEASAPECSGGLPAASAGGTAADRQAFPTLVQAPRDLWLHFGGSDGAIPTGETVLDMQVESEGRAECLRLPFTNTAATGWSPAMDWFFGVVADVRFPAPSHASIGSAVSLGIPIGRWFGDGRVWLEPRLTSRGPTFGVALLGEFPLLHHGSFALALGGGYGVSSTTAGLGQPDYLLLHGPEAALRFKFVYPPQLGTSGFPGSPRLGSWELILPVGYRFGVGTETDRVGFVVGFGIAWNAG